MRPDSSSGSARTSLAVAQRGSAIDDHGRDSHRILKGTLEGGRVSDAGGVEDHDIGGEPRLEPSAIIQAHTRCGNRGHLPDRVAERERLPLAHVTTEDACEAACSAGVMTAAARRTIDRESSTIGAYHAERMSEYPLQVFLAHREAEHSHTPFAAAKESGRGLVRIAAGRLCPGTEPLALRTTVLSRAHRRDLHVVPSADELDLGERLAPNAFRGCVVRQ